MNAVVSMKVGQLKSCLNDIERICNDRAYNSGGERVNKIVACVLLFPFQIFKRAKKRITAQSCFEYCSYKPLVKSSPSVLFVNEF